MSDWETLFVKARHRNCGVMMWRVEALAGCWLVKTSGGEAMMWRAEVLALA